MAAVNIMLFLIKGLGLYNIIDSSVSKVMTLYFNCYFNDGFVLVRFSYSCSSCTCMISSSARMVCVFVIYCDTCH